MYKINFGNQDKLCNFSSNNKYDHKRHLSSKKHIKNQVKEMESEFTIKTYERELAKRDRELYEKELKRNEEQKKEIEYYQNALIVAGNVLQSTVSSLTYANSVYASAPAIQTIKFEQVKQIKDSLKNFVYGDLRIFNKTSHR